GGGEDAEDAFEQGGLAAAGGADQRVQAAGGKRGGGLADEGGGSGLGADAECGAGRHGAEVVVGRGGWQRCLRVAAGLILAGGTMTTGQGAFFMTALVVLPTSRS